MRIHLGLISRTRLITAGFISGPIPASARNPQQDLVETTSPGQHSPSARSDLIETTSLRRPIGPSTRSPPLSQSDSREETDPVQTPPRAALTLVWTCQKPLQPPASRVRTALQLYWKSLAALQSLLSLASALTRLVNGSDLLHGALRDRGPPHLPLLSVIGSIHLPL